MKHSPRVVDCNTRLVTVTDLPTYHTIPSHFPTSPLMSARHAHALLTTYSERSYPATRGRGHADPGVRYGA